MDIRHWEERFMYVQFVSYVQSTLRDKQKIFNRKWTISAGAQA